MIKSAGNGKYKVVSEKGKALSKAVSHSAAVRRLRQVEWFKHHGKG